MVPVLIWLVLLIPGLPGDGGAAVYHVPPASISRRGHQGQRGRVLAVLEQTLQQILCRVDRSRHSATDEPLRDLRPTLGRHEPKGQGKQVCMQRSMIRSYSVTIEPTRRIKELLLEGRLRRPLLLPKLRGLLLFAQGLGQFAHLLQCAQMESVDYRVDAGKDVAVAFVHRPVNIIPMSNQLRRAHDQPVRSDALVQQLGL